MLSAIFCTVCYGTAKRTRYASTITEAIQIIEKNSLEEKSQRDLFKAAMKGMMQSLDEHSNFYDGSDYQKFYESLDQEFGGIGILVEYNEKEESVMVVTPLFDTPAYHAGMRAGDIIQNVDGTDIKGMPTRDVIKIMKGKIGTKTTVDVRHISETEVRTYDIERKTISVPSVSGDRRAPDGTWIHTLEDNPRIGYVRLGQFGERSVEEMQTVLADLSDTTDGLILDLRYNPGGLLSGAIDISDMFLPEGKKIVSTRGREKTELESFFSTSSTHYPQSKPLVILTNNFSASASEIVAACLQDYGRATIVGERTFGKGTVQNVIELEPRKSLIKLTTASYWRPSGKNIHRLSTAKEEDDWGVRPNEGFEIPLDAEGAAKVLQYRNFREIKDIPGAAQAREQVEKAEDPQFNSALEHLLSKIPKSKAA